MEEKVVYGALTVYRERGAYLRRLEQFDKAKASYDEAYKIAPEDVAVLLGRSRVCACAMQAEQAYSDADAALKLDPRSMIALNVQAGAQYTMCDFERSVVMNYRGARERSCPPYFLEGIITGVETIQNCIGKNAGQVMLDLKPIIMHQERNKNSVNDEVRLHACRIPRPNVKQKMTQQEKRRHDLLSRKLAMKYLGPLANDKLFLQELINDHRIPSANASGSREIQKIAQEALKTYCVIQEMLRTQRPYYSIQLAEKSKSNYLTKYRKELFAKECKVSARNAERYMTKITDSLLENKLNEVIVMSERMQAFLDSRTLQTLPDKDTYIDRLYRAVGEGYLNMHRLSYNMSEYSTRRRIAFLMGLPVGRPKSFDSVRATYPYKYVDPRATLQKLENLIEMCENNYMRCCLYYEMARLQNSQKNYPLAKLYAKRCQAQAHELDCHTWWLNGCFILMASDMQQGNQHDIRIAVEEALEYIKNTPSLLSIQLFLHKCAELAAQPANLDDNKARKQREEQILRIMDDKSKVDTGVLFRHMSRLPPGRRFDVLPRKREASVRYEPERRRRLQRGLSVVPGKERALRHTPRSKVPGFQKFSDVSS